MIQKVSSTLSIKNNYGVKNNKKEVRANKHLQNHIQPNINSRFMNNDQVSFKGKSSSKAQNEDIVDIAEMARRLDRNYAKTARDLINDATTIAMEYGHPEVNELHFEKAALQSMGKFLNELDEGLVALEDDSPYQLPAFFADHTTVEAIKDKKEREKLKPVIKEEIDLLDKKLSQIPSKKITKKPRIADNLVEAVDGIFKSALISVGPGTEEIPILDAAFLRAIYDGNPNPETNNLKIFLSKLSEAVMTDSRKPEEKIPLSLYDDPAKNLLKNLSLGTNMFITHDDKTNPMYLIDTVVRVFSDPNSNLDLGNMKKENTRITIFNDNIKENFVVQTVKKLAKDKKNNHILFVNMDQMLKNSPKIAISEEGLEVRTLAFGDEIMDIMEDTPKNIKIVFVEDKDYYLKNTSKPELQKIFANFGAVSANAMNTEQAKKAFREQPLLMHKIEKEKHFTKAAIDKAIEASTMLDGGFPEKTQGLMKKMASYYVGEKEVNETQVKKYVEQAKDMFRITSADSSVEVIFDTNVKLKDLTGKEATKKEAETIIKQIKSGIMGTKGAIIYSQDDSVGSGRKFTAKAIASETKSPYIELDARDFGAEALDLFGTEPVPTERAIKQLGSLVKTQAEASPHKSAVVVIQNFEYLPFGQELTYSAHYPKSMAQFQREMDSWAKKGLNVLVLGSVSDAETAEFCSENILNFKDRIMVESPARNINARKDILTSLLKKENLKLAGKTEAENKELVKLMAETTEYFPFVELVNMTRKLKTVAFEKGQKLIDKSVIIESYLQLTSGRPASGPISDHRKQIVASHECGHGFNLEYMHMLAEKQNVPWHLGGRVNFITLDPRGDFGGCMSGNDIENEEHSFEKVFTEGVCDFGGHSAEKHFYNIDGSWGITADMEMATHNAETSVGLMGQGRNFGKKSIGGMFMKLSEKEHEAFALDRDVQLKNQGLVSDLITKFGTTFNREFTAKNWALSGTGNCLIHGDQFRADIKDWLSRQTPEKLHEREELDKTILDIIEHTKNGKVFDIEGKKVPKSIKKLYMSVAHSMTEASKQKSAISVASKAVANLKTLIRSIK